MIRRLRDDKQPELNMNKLSVYVGACQTSKHFLVCSVTAFFPRSLRLSLVYPGCLEGISKMEPV